MQSGEMVSGQFLAPIENDKDVMNIGSRSPRNRLLDLQLQWLLLPVTRCIPGAA
ncbi:uncharacterized protein METZ01_LOCUS327073 [marine metagenome]|uniref:Uncharacterized protein n=1 Tax=marine metagenome TaxID=408172 RepID=A0A382PLE5_9ZZZZ